MRVQEPYRPDWKEGVPDPEVHWLCQHYPPSVGLSREDILKISDRNDATRRRRILVASLMSGYGLSGLRWHGFKPVNNMLNDPTLDDRLAKCEESLKHGDLDTAYSTMSEPQIPRIGPAYFTKVLYFLGRSTRARPQYPLILDTFVSESLAWLTGYRALVKVYYWPVSSPETYVTYVRTMHDWAMAIGTSAETIEFYLYRCSSSRRPDDFGAQRGRFREACRHM